MAIGVLLDGPNWTRENYDEINRRMFGSSTLTPDKKPDGLILHTAGQGPSGWRVVDVWESREHFERFLEESVMPAAQAMNAPQTGDPQIWELDNVFPERTG